MAKLIKRSTDAEEITSTQDPQGARRSSIIDRNTFEARVDAQQIRERAQAQAKQIVEDAKQQAQKMIDEAQTKAMDLKSSAKDEGFREGQREGAEQLTSAIAEASMRVQYWESQLVPQLKELAVAIAKKILGKELEFYPEEVVNIIKQALSEKARMRREIVLRVHPEDLEVVRENKAELLDVLTRCKEIGIREDAEVERYSVVIETDAGTIDAQLSTQLAVFERVFKNVG